MTGAQRGARRAADPRSWWPGFRRMTDRGGQLADEFVGASIDDWVGEGHLSPEAADELRRRLATPEVALVLRNFGVHLAITIPLRFPFGSLTRSCLDGRLARSRRVAGAAPPRVRESRPAGPCAARHVRHARSRLRFRRLPAGHAAAHQPRAGGDPARPRAAPSAAARLRPAPPRRAHHLVGSPAAEAPAALVAREAGTGAARTGSAPAHALARDHGGARSQRGRAPGRQHPREQLRRIVRFLGEPGPHHHGQRRAAACRGNAGRARVPLVLVPPRGGRGARRGGRHLPLGAHRQRADRLRDRRLLRAPRAPRRVDHRPHRRAAAAHEQRRRRDHARLWRRLSGRARSVPAGTLRASRLLGAAGGGRAPRGLDAPRRRLRARPARLARGAVPDDRRCAAPARAPRP